MLSLDTGAQQAIEQQGRSLLAIGVRQVEGSFQKGDVVSLCRENRQEFARGLTNYGSEELHRIAGRATEDIIGILGHCPHDEVIHRDNLVILS
jgi:glutamate 5-kinase